MASSNPNNPSPSLPLLHPTNTTFVHADPSTFRALVQRLTGSTQLDPSTQKLPVTVPARCKPAAGVMGPRRPAFKLHERRQIARKLEIKLNNGVGSSGTCGSPSPRKRSFSGFGGEMMMMVSSPVSTLDMFARGSPRSPVSPNLEEEDRAIAAKGFYLHPSPLTTPRGSEPELLPLFPLHSPRDINKNM